MTCRTEIRFILQGDVWCMMQLIADRDHAKEHLRPRLSDACSVTWHQSIQMTMSHNRMSHTLMLVTVMNNWDGSPTEHWLHYKMELDGLPSTDMPPRCDHDPSTVWLQNLISKFMNPSTFVTKIRWNSLCWFLRHGVHEVFGTHRLIHGRTHPKTLCRRYGRFSVADA